MKKVAFVCVHNSCRSQIAEALGKHFAEDFFESFSAGTEIKPKINADAVRLMKELYGIDMEKTQYSKLLEDIPRSTWSLRWAAAWPVLISPVSTKKIGASKIRPEKVTRNLFRSSGRSK